MPLVEITFVTCFFHTFEGEILRPFDLFFEVKVTDETQALAGVLGCKSTLHFLQRGVAVVSAAKSMIARLKRSFLQIFLG